MRQTQVYYEETDRLRIELEWRAFRTCVYCIGCLFAIW